MTYFGLGYFNNGDDITLLGSTCIVYLSAPVTTISVLIFLWIQATKVLSLDLKETPVYFNWNFPI